MNNFNRVVIFSGSIRTSLIRLLLQQLLGFGVRKAQQQLDAILAWNVMETLQDFLSNLACLKAVKYKSAGNKCGLEGICLPGKTNFFAHAGLFIPADFLRYHAIWLEMSAQVLRR